MKVIFVCTGNTCRSPMAEYILKSMDPKVEVSSAGIRANPGEPISSHAQNVIFRELSCLVDHRARALTRDEMADADLILTMTSTQRDYLRAMGDYPVFSLKEYAGETGDVADPIGGDYGEYLDTFFQLKRLIGKLKI